MTIFIVGRVIPMPPAQKAGLPTVDVSCFNFIKSLSILKT